MKQPYEDMLKSAESRLNNLGFHLTHHGEYGQIFESEQFEIIFDLDQNRSELNFSIHHKPRRAMSSLATFALMPALDPEAYKLLSNQPRTMSGERNALEIYISFLERFQDIVFSHPLSEPYRERYIQIESDVIRKNNMKPPEANEYEI